eukprot:s4100_g2.t1
MFQLSGVHCSSNREDAASFQPQACLKVLPVYITGEGFTFHQRPPFVAPRRLPGESAGDAISPKRPAFHAVMSSTLPWAGYLLKALSFHSWFLAVKMKTPTAALGEEQAPEAQTKEAAGAENAPAPGSVAAFDRLLAALTPPALPVARALRPSLKRGAVFDCSLAHVALRSDSSKRVLKRQLDSRDWRVRRPAASPYLGGCVGGLVLELEDLL